MNLFEALENLASNLLGVMDDLRELRRDFHQTCGELARTGAELFTLGFQEMVLNKNNAWQTSEENLAEARRIVREARYRYPELDTEYEQGRILFEEQWQALEEGRTECWEALQELNLTFLQGGEAFQTSPGTVMGLPEASDKEKSNLDLSVSLPSPDPSISKVLVCIETMAYKKLLREQGFYEQPQPEGSETSPDWLQRVWDHHRHSEEEVLAARVCAENSDIVESIVVWECTQFEPLTDLAHRAIRLFHAGTEYCLTQANEIEKWLKRRSCASSQDDTFWIKFRATIKVAHILAEIVVCPLVHNVEGGPCVNPVFATRVLSAEGLFDSL